MTGILLGFDVLLSIFVIALAFAALTSREPRRAVILFIALGLLLALALGCPGGTAAVSTTSTSSPALAR